MKKDIYIIRHGETEYNRMGIVQGQGVDTSLNELGRRQARAFYEHYKDTGFEVVLTSRLRRTHETVSPFIGQGLPWEQFAEINEIAWGEHEGKKSTPEMMQQYREVTDAWKRGEYDARLEGAESAPSLFTMKEYSRATNWKKVGKPIPVLLIRSTRKLMSWAMCWNPQRWFMEGMRAAQKRQD